MKIHKEVLPDHFRMVPDTLSIPEVLWTDGTREMVLINCFPHSFNGGGEFRKGYIGSRASGNQDNRKSGK